MSKIWWSQRGRRWQYGSTLHAGQLRLHARERARTRTHTYTLMQQYVILIASPLQQWFRERASFLRYTYIVCLVVRLSVCVFVILKRLAASSSHFEIELTKDYKFSFPWTCFSKSKTSSVRCISGWKFFAMECYLQNQRNMWKKAHVILTITTVLIY